jgi:hypothetical protein
MKEKLESKTFSHYNSEAFFEYFLNLPRPKEIKKCIG